MRGALGELGLPDDVRAERLAPEQFAELARLIGSESLRSLRGRQGGEGTRRRRA